MCPKDNAPPKDSSKKYLIVPPPSAIEDFTLDSAAVFRTFGIIFVYGDLLSKVYNFVNSESSDKPNYKPYLGLLMLLPFFIAFVTLIPYDRYQTRKWHRLKSSDVETELNKSLDAIERKFAHDSDAKLKQIDRVLEGLTYDNQQENKIYLKASNYIVWWELGSGTLYKELLRVKNIYEMLPPNLQPRSAMAFPLREDEEKFKAPTRFADFPSKSRTLMLPFILLGYYIAFSKFLAVFAPILASHNWPYIAFLLLLTTLQVAENFILNERREQYRLEGFDLFCGPWDLYDKYCIGQQIDTGHILSRSSTLNNAIKYLIQAYEHLFNSTAAINRARLERHTKADIARFLNFFSQHTTVNEDVRNRLEKGQGDPISYRA